MNCPPNTALQRTPPASPVPPLSFRAFGAARILALVATGALGFANALLGGSPKRGPLRDVPPGWEYRPGGVIHYWSGSYADTRTGAQVEFQIGAPGDFADPCGDDDSWATKTHGVARGIAFCVTEISNIRAWTQRELWKHFPDYEPGNEKHDFGNALPPEGSSFFGITFLMKRETAVFRSVFCSPEELARILDLLTNEMRLDPRAVAGE